MNNQTTVAGITYTLPQVVLLQETGLGTAELAARTCYDSFEASEHNSITNFNNNLNELLTLQSAHTSDTDGELSPLPLTAAEVRVGSVNNINHSELLDKLAWTHFHHSILEHTNLTYLIRGTSRGVLQEHARHRIQAISVRSTRYTMSNVINAFVAELAENYSNTVPSEWFIKTMQSLDLFVTSDSSYNKLQIEDIFKKLKHQYKAIGREAFLKLAIAKSSLHYTANNLNSESLFTALQAGKSKRNVGDSFKHIVNDIWKVDLVVTFNLRSLKNYFELRDSGAAYFQIQWLAQAMKATTPSKYLDLIVKSK